MDHSLMAKVAEYVLSLPVPHKEYSDKWCGVYVYGDNKKFVLRDHVHAFYAFNVFSKFRYPIYFFCNESQINEDVRSLLFFFDNIILKPIAALKSEQEYNFWFINNLWSLIPEKHEWVSTIQFDGYLIKEGFEDFVEGRDIDYWGAKWKNPIKVFSSKLDIPEVQIGNGGCSIRRRAKIKEVIDTVNESLGGQLMTVNGMYIPNESKGINLPYINEDLFFCALGNALGLIKLPTLEEADKFALEPMPYAIFQDESRRPFGFHRIDE